MASPVFTSLKIGIFFSLFMIVFCPHAQSIVGSEPKQSADYTNLSIQFILVSAKTSFQVFEGQELLNLEQDVATGPTQVFSSLAGIATDKDIEIMFIKDNAIIDSLDAADIARLSTLAKQGLFLGIPGDGTHMRDVLDITDETDQAFVTNPESTIYFTYGVPDGCRDDFQLSTQFNPTVGQLLRTLFAWIDDVRENHASNPAQYSDVWKATYTHDWRGTLQSESSYRFLLSIFKLDSASTELDWYLVVANYQSSINPRYYHCISWGCYCGPYTYAMNLQADIDKKHGAMLYGYMPTGTVASTTQSFTIGASLKGKTPGISASISKTYNAPDVVISDKSHYLYNMAKWVVTLRGPSYLTYPFIKQPCNAAMHSYQIDPSFIVQTPKNTPLEITFHPKIGQQTDYLTWYFVYTQADPDAMYWSVKPITVKVGP